MLYSTIGEKQIGRNRQAKLSAVFLAAVFTLFLGIAAPDGWSDDDDNEIPFDEANIFFELNNTDGDLGIHALIDGEPWKKLEIEDPNERKMLNIRVKGRLRKQGLTEIFFESAEPTFDELSPEEFFNRFPEGWYEIEGKTLDGEELESTTWLSHVMPAPPDNVKVSGIDAAENCDVPNLPEVPDGETAIISWDPVMGSHPDLGKEGPVEVVSYQVVVEEEESGLVLNVYLPPDVTSFEVPEGFIDLGEAFKFEILVREVSGNQTAVESCFEIE
jgi:hypothetical protein